MRIAKNKTSRTGSIATLVFLLVSCYFCYHAISGERGLLALMELSKKVEDSRQQLDIINADRLKLEHRVSLLRDESLDLDLLDEQARRLLGYVAADETLYQGSHKTEQKAN